MPRAFSAHEQRRIRARLLEAARLALPKTGFRRTSVEALTRAAGISKGAFYVFFDSKEALWMALLQEEEQDARARVLAAAAAPGPDRIGRILRALLDGLATSPGLVALTDPEEAAWLTRSLPAEVWAEARRDDDRFFGELWSSLRASGELAPDVSAAVFAGLPRALLALAQQRALLGEDRAEAVIGVVVEGLARRLSALPGER